MKINFAPASSIKYGLLYNYYAATDVRYITSVGWHVPSQPEYATMFTVVGGLATAGNMLQDHNKLFWADLTYTANTFKWNGRGGGNRGFTNGLFGNTRGVGQHIATGDQFAGWNYTFQLDGGNNLIARMLSYPYIQGRSIRILKDSTTLTPGQTGVYIGNDGRHYRTICIGTQEWLADNLAETRYRDGSLIPEVTDTTAWQALTTGGLCAHSNDWRNVFYY